MKVLNLVWGILLVVFGLTSFALPILFVESLSWLIGILLVLTGLSVVVTYFFLIQNKTVGRWYIALSLLLLVVGSIMWVSPEFPALFFALVFAVWTLGVGATELRSALYYRSTGQRFNWMWTLLLAIVSLLSAAYILLSLPLFLTQMTGILLGIALSVQGIHLIMLGLFDI
ncbi:MAG: DUF308 domain-containing protein [Lachnospiraceae bacterium]